MTDFIAPIDRDYTLEEVRSWRSQPQGEPLPLLPDSRRSTYYTGAGFRAEKPPKYLVENADRYYANFQLINNDGRAQICDSLGVVHDLPAGIASLTPITWSTPSTGGPRFFHSGSKDYAILRDAAGTALFVFPGYGWDYQAQMKPFIEALGWRLEDEIDVEIAPDQRDTIIPGWLNAPVADVGEGLRGPEDDPYLRNSIDGDLRVGPSTKSRWWRR